MFIMTKVLRHLHLTDHLIPLSEHYCVIRIFTNTWTCLQTVVDICMKLDEGKYLLVKDPNKPTVRYYSADDCF